METAGGTGSYWTAACLIAYSPLIGEARSLNACFSKGSPHPPHYCDRLAQLREPSCLVRARTEIGRSAAYEFFSSVRVTLGQGSDAMLVTEREARSLWCPMVRVHGRSLNAANRVNPGLGRRFKYWLLRTFFPRLYWFLMARYYACVGSKCMMWRWESESSPRGFCGLMGHQTHVMSPRMKV